MEQSKLRETFKSGDTEEWLDIVWTRPVGYAMARLGAAWGIHPNAITVTSMVVGALSSLCFVHGSFYYEGARGLWLNVAGVVMLAVANFMDSADGQLARMTNQKTRLGRILDGAAGDVWFIPIYVCLVARFHTHHALEFALLGFDDTPRNAALATLAVFVMACVSGFVCHAGQCRLADYYRQIHLYFLRGSEGSELDSWEQQRQLCDATSWRGNVLWKFFLCCYVRYTRSQERETPQFQRLRRLLRERYGTADRMPQELREAFRQGSLPLMKYTNILTFNTRAAALYVSALADVPVAYLFFEMVVLSVLKAYMHRRHEALCRGMAEQLGREERTRTT